MKLFPIGRRMYVKADPVEAEQTKGGIWVPDKHSVPSRLGTVLEVGDEVTKFRVGDRVLLSYYSGVVVVRQELDEARDGADVHRIILEDEILAKVEE